MSHSSCFLCGSEASLKDEPDLSSGLTAVDCPNCGRYSLTPQAWTADERLCLAAYVQHENKSGRRPPAITEDNQSLLIRLGEGLRAKTKRAGR